MKRILKKLWEESKNDWRHKNVGGRIFLIIRSLIITGFIIYIFATALFFIVSFFILIAKALAVA